MALARAQVLAVACSVPGCRTTDQFVMPCDLQRTGWLEVARLGDSSTQKRGHICPKHAKPLGLNDNDFAESPEAEPVTERGFTPIGGVPFPTQLFPEVTPQLRALLTGGNPKQLKDSDDHE